VLVKNVMYHDVMTIDGDSSLTEAAKAMFEKQRALSSAFWTLSLVSLRPASFSSIRRKRKSLRRGLCKQQLEG
jgi:hypothetical protein